MFTSKGIKRLIASILLPIIGILKAIPGTAEIIAVLETIAGLFGLAGVAHAVPAKTLDKKKLASLAAALAVLLRLLPLIPWLQPYEELIQQIAEIIGALAAGTYIPQISKKEMQGMKTQLKQKQKAIEKLKQKTK